VLRRDVDEIVSALDPDNPDDAPWIEEERKIAEENGLKFTLMPLDPLSPDPAAVRKVVRHVKDAEGKVYVHDFLDTKRFEAIERGLAEGAPLGADQVGGEGRARRGPVPG
jgi:sugar phosphate isomerase/epimerase